MSIRYDIHLYDHTGALLAVFDDFRFLNINKRVNTPANFSFGIQGDDSRISLFDVDDFITVRRWDAANGITRYAEVEGFFRTQTRQTFENSERQFVAYAQGYMELLKRRIIAHYAGSIYTDKAGPAETVMKEYTNENAGPGATSPPRIADGVFPGLIIQADAAQGDVWTGQRSYRNLLEVLQEIAVFGSVDFDILRSPGIAQFIFMTYYPQRGEDRTTDGLDPATGLNAAGNPPVVFSLSTGTMTDATYSFNRDQEINRCYALGQGEESNREISVRDEAVSQADSPWNIRESSRNASTEDELAGLESAGDQVLELSQAREKFTFEAVQQPSLLYGLHYSLGDMITARYDDIEKNKKIVGVRISVKAGNQPRETVTLEFADIQ